MSGDENNDAMTQSSDQQVVLPPCEHCGSHDDPDRKPWSVWLYQPHDNSKPTALTVAKSDGSHVAESDAIWMRAKLNDRPMDVNP